MAPKKTKSEKKDEKVKDEKVKDVSEKEKEKKGRVEYPLAEGDTIEVVPADFSFEKYFPIKKPFWEQDYLYIDHRADEAEWRCQALRLKAKKMKELGSAADRARMNRLQKMTAKMAELRKELEESGIDVDSLLEAEES